MRKQRIQLPLIGGHNQPGIRMVDDELCVNWIPQRDAGGRRTLVPAPGLALEVSAGPGPSRSNGVEWGGAAYFVSGAKLIKIDASGTVTEAGTLATSQGYCCIAAGFAALAIVDGEYGYKYDGTNLTQIDDVDMPLADFVEWIDKYYIYTQKDTGNFYISAFEDPATIDALDYGNAEARPDNLKRAIEHGGDLLLIGENSAELWHNTGNPLFPWEPYIGAVYPWGTSAPHSAAKLGGWLFILARVENGGHSIIKTAGGQVQKISTPALDLEISALDIESAWGCAYEQNGRGYYRITFPGDGKSYVYEDGEGYWHERRSKDDAIIPLGQVFHGDKHLVGDYNSQKVYELRTDQYSDDGAEITRIRRGPRIEAEGRVIVVHSVEIRLEPGVGLVTGQGSDPLIWIRYTFDGFKWSHELYGSPGKLGEYEHRCVFYKLGAGPMFALEIGASDPVNWTIVDAWADITTGA